jgi:hypothetical protein
MRCFTPFDLVVLGSKCPSSVFNPILMYELSERDRLREKLDPGTIAAAERVPDGLSGRRNAVYDP